ncbi:MULTISPECIES: hypothetical protein [Halomonadaceae]|uniref:Uncharacterized protein n=1 Tax=Vreelandella halophila TaxID=86177 RepID=A0A9X4YE47_9GAMM|nr:MULTISPECIES: hypothetical protein [Halomonas]MYL28147.1 hypothetical protein [Halomonas utahensis]MYL76054.1 hypothetical protein [Halomonas sp. 22501_18_FS]
MSRITAIAFLLITLAGCTDEQRIAALENQLEAKQATIERLENEHHEALRESERRIDELQTELASLKNGVWFQQHRAGIARACDWVVPSCPPSWIEGGRKALAQGFSGTWSWWFWLVIFLKLILVPFLLAGLIATYAYWVRPARTEVERVAAELKELQSNKAGERKELKALAEELERRQKEEAELETRVSAFQRHRQQLKSEIENLEKKKRNLRGGF